MRFASLATLRAGWGRGSILALCPASLGVASIWMGMLGINSPEPNPRPIVDPPEWSLVDSPANKPVPLVFRIENRGRRPIRIVGADDRCDGIEGCSITKGLPLTIDAGGSSGLEVLFKPRPGPYVYRLSLSTDDPDNPVIVIPISG